MRIITQIGYDFPYEQILVYLYEREICCKPISIPEERYFLLGEYDTEERAEEVFKKLHDYISCEDEPKMFYMPDE